MNEDIPVKKKRLSMLLPLIAVAIAAVVILNAGADQFRQGNNETEVSLDAVDSKDTPISERTESLITKSVDIATLYIDPSYTTGQQQAQRHSIKAHALIQHFFGNSVKIDKTNLGPSGTVQLFVTNTSTGTRHTVYMLPDGENLIFGTLVSPYQPLAKEIASLLLSGEGLSNGELLADVVASTPRKPDATELPSEFPVINKAQSLPSGNDGKTEGKTVNIKKSENKKNVLGLPETIEERIGTVPLMSALRPSNLTATLPDRNKVVDKASLYKKVQNSHLVTEGTGKKIIYAFFDPNCSACLQAHAAITPFIKSGEITVNWIPVAIRGKDSVAKVTVILSKPEGDRLATLKQMMVDKTLSEIGEVSMTKDEVVAARLKYGQNTQLLLAETPMQSTPTFMYMSSTGPQLVLPNNKASIAKIVKNAVTK